MRASGENRLKNPRSEALQINHKRSQLTFATSAASRCDRASFPSIPVATESGGANGMKMHRSALRQRNCAALSNKRRTFRSSCVNGLRRRRIVKAPSTAAAICWPTSARRAILSFDVATVLQTQPGADYLLIARNNPSAISVLSIAATPTARRLVCRTSAMSRGANRRRETTFFSSILA
jgi:hypothetical protein